MEPPSPEAVYLLRVGRDQRSGGSRLIEARERTHTHPTHDPPLPLIQARGEPRIPASLPRLQSNESPPPLLERISRLQTKAPGEAGIQPVSQPSCLCPPPDPSVPTGRPFRPLPPPSFRALSPPTTPNGSRSGAHLRKQRPKMAAVRKKRKASPRGTLG